MTPQIAPAGPLFSTGVLWKQTVDICSLWDIWNLYECVLAYLWQQILRHVTIKPGLVCGSDISGNNIFFGDCRGAFVPQWKLLLARLR